MAPPAGPPEPTDAVAASLSADCPPLGGIWPEDGSPCSPVSAVAPIRNLGEISSTAMSWIEQFRRKESVKIEIRSIHFHVNKGVAVAWLVHASALAFTTQTKIQYFAFKRLHSGERPKVAIKSWAFVDDHWHANEAWFFTWNSICRQKMRTTKSWMNCKRQYDKSCLSDWNTLSREAATWAQR